jgi:hypothetical protein
MTADGTSTLIRGARVFDGALGSVAALARLFGLTDRGRIAPRSGATAPGCGARRTPPVSWSRRRS